MPDSHGETVIWGYERIVVFDLHYAPLHPEPRLGIVYVQSRAEISGRTRVYHNRGSLHR